MASYNMTETAEILGVSYSTIQRLMSAKKLPCAHIGGRVLICEQDIALLVGESRAKELCKDYETTKGNRPLQLTVYRRRDTMGGFEVFYIGTINDITNIKTNVQRKWEAENLSPQNISLAERYGQKIPQYDIAKHEGYIQEETYPLSKLLDMFQSYQRKVSEQRNLDTIFLPELNGILEPLLERNKTNDKEMSLIINPPPRISKDLQTKLDNMKYIKMKCSVSYHGEEVDTMGRDIKVNTVYEIGKTISKQLATDWIVAGLAKPLEQLEE